MTPNDRVADEIWREVGRLFRQLDLTAEEKRWIEENAAAMNKYAVERFSSDPNTRSMRPLIIAYAVAQFFVSAGTIDELTTNPANAPEEKSN